jgi:hypothetical protein
MGDKADALKALGVSADVAKAVEKAGAYVSIVGDAFTAYSVGKSVLQMFGVIEGDHSLQDIKDELDAIEQKIDSVLHDLEADILGAARQQMRTAIAEKVAEATTSLHAAEGYVKAPHDPQQQAVFALAIRDSGQAVTALADDAYWKLVFSPRVFYNDSWSGTLLPSEAPEGGLVFDYRCALPAYLAAILSRIVVLTAADQTFKSQLMSEIENGANHLLTIHLRIVKQFAFISPPPLSWYITPTASDSWRTLNYIYGVVERYSGTSRVGGFPWQEIPDFMLWDATDPAITLPPVLTNPSSPEASQRYDLFAVRYELRTRVLSVAHYRTIGLESLWNIINKLYTMIGKQPAAVPSELRRYTVLSMRDAYTAFPQWVKTEMGGNIGLNQMCGKLNVRKPYSLSKLFSS